MALKKKSIEIAENAQVKKLSAKEISERSSFPIIGIGASAGGLEAIEQFFSNMPPDSGTAFVIVQHLDPTAHSSMPEILSRFTKMPVQVAPARAWKCKTVFYTFENRRSLPASGFLLISSFVPWPKKWGLTPSVLYYPGPVQMVLSA